MDPAVARMLEKGMRRSEEEEKGGKRVRGKSYTKGRVYKSTMHLEVEMEVFKFSLISILRN